VQLRRHVVLISLAKLLLAFSSAAIGGDNIGETIEGQCALLARNQDSVETIRALPMLTEHGAQVRLRDAAAFTLATGRRF